MTEGNLVAAAVLSGNRNFEGRINPLVKANYLASPPLVVAYALAGTIDIDLATEPLGHRPRRPAGLPEGHLAQPGGSRRGGHRRRFGPEMFRRRYGNVFEAQRAWNAIPVAGSELYDWDADSTYIQEPPFLIDLGRGAQPDPADPAAPGCWLALGDSVTTDHISPAGSIASQQPGRQVSCRSTASRRSISTATAPAAATTG